MASTNYNITIDSGVVTFRDAAGNAATLATATSENALLEKIAPKYAKQNYSAKSLVSHEGKLYYNANSVTAENWTAAHWTECTVASWVAALG